MTFFSGMVGKSLRYRKFVPIQVGSQWPRSVFPSRRWIQISTRPAGETPQLQQLPVDTTTEFEASGPDAKFEVLGAPYSLLSASLSASQPLYTRRGTLVGLSGKADNVVSTLSILEPFRRIVLGIPFFYQKVTSASPVSVLISTKSSLTSFATIHLDGTLDWMISQRTALLGWTGQTLSLSPRMDTSLSLANWGQTRVTGRGLLALVGKGQIYEVALKPDEQYVVHPSNIVAYSITKNPPLPYRFKSSVLRFQIPGAGIVERLVPDVKFFRTMQETATWKLISRMLYGLRTWSRRTIWGDRLFLQFQGPTTILLQTRASRVSDVLTSRDVNEIADSEPGLIQVAATNSPEKSKPQEQQPAVTPPPPIRMSYASVGGHGQVKFEGKARTQT